MRLRPVKAPERGPDRRNRAWLSNQLSGLEHTRSGSDDPRQSMYALQSVVSDFMTEIEALLSCSCGAGPGWPCLTPHALSHMGCCAAWCPPTMAAPSWRTPSMARKGLSSFLAAVSQQPLVSWPGPALFLTTLMTAATLPQGAGGEGRGVFAWWPGNCAAVAASTQAVFESLGKVGLVAWNGQAVSLTNTINLPHTIKQACRRSAPPAACTSGHRNASA